MSRRKRQKLSAAGQEAVTFHDGYEAQPQDSAFEDLPKPNPDSRSKSLFVHSLLVDTTNDSLSKHFSQLYPLKYATIVTDAITKKSKGYGFVTFADATDAQNAKTSLDGSILDGKKIKVELAEPRHREEGQSGESIPQQSIASDTPRKRKKPEIIQPPKLIVRNLPWTFRESEQLAQLFRSYGKVKYATLPRRQSGLAPGFGFVTLRGRKNAEKALEGINGSKVDGRILAVDWAVEKDTWTSLQDQTTTAKDSHEDTHGNHIVEEGETAGDAALVRSDSVDSAASGSESTSKPDDLYQSDDKDSSNGLERKKAVESTFTLFVRNVPFGVTDDVLHEHFSLFGNVRYARVVQDPSTDRSRGTAFVAFYNPEDAKSCLNGFQKAQVSSARGKALLPMKSSVLEDVRADPTGRYTLDGRVLHISQAVDRGEAKRLTIAGSSLREIRDKDKRRLYLLSEGTVPSNSPLYDHLSPSEIKLREDSAKQRQALIRSNPSLHISLTRLSVRNLPRTMTSKDLKELARKAVVGFATDVKEGRRQPLSKEELARGGIASKETERIRKAKGKGIVKQAKIVFEGLGGGKVTEKSGAGRSRGYGFIEYTSHRCALMGLRWLNGHAVTAQPSDDQQNKASDERKKRLIIEFAIENAQVVARRQEREANLPRTMKKLHGEHDRNLIEQSRSDEAGKTTTVAQPPRERKRNRAPDAGLTLPTSKPASTSVGNAGVVEQPGRRQQIIGRKRMMRKARKKSSAE